MRSTTLRVSSKSTVKAVQGGAAGELDVDQELVPIGVGKELRGPEGAADEQERGGDAGREQPDHDAAALDCEAQDREVERDQSALETLARGARAVVEGDREQGRHEVGHEHGAEEHGRDHDGNAADELADVAPHHHERDEGRDRGRGAGEDGEVDLGQPLDRGLPGRKAQVEVALDAVRHDDRLVHHDADGDDQGRDGDLVQRHVGDALEAEGHGQGQGDRDRHDEARAPAHAEEREGHDQGETHPQAPQQQA
jgi:hypothetical protein